MNVVLVHGFLNSGGILRALGRYLESAGHRCFIPTLTPSDARGGLPLLAEPLKRFIERQLPLEEPFAIVGFSMGAIVARYYLQELGGHDRAKAYFSIAGPHLGTLTAYLYPTDGVRQMRPGSALLTRLEQTAHRLADIPTTCYWTPMDLMIRPIRSTRWIRGEPVRIPTLLHALLVFDKRLFRDIAARLNKLSVDRADYAAATPAVRATSVDVPKGVPHQPES